MILDIIKENQKKYSKLFSFGDLLYYSYANIQMLDAAIGMGKTNYDRQCYMIRSKAFKAYKAGNWEIHNLFNDNIAKLKSDSFCWYCGKHFDNKVELTVDHVFPRCKGGTDDMNNIIMVCKHCNSSKRDIDLFEWYFEKRNEFPPLNILIHYLKLIYLYSKDNGLLSKPIEELELIQLPFNYKYIPLRLPQPYLFIK